MVEGRKLVDLLMRSFEMEKGGEGMNREKVKDLSILKRDSVERIIDQVGNY